MVNEDYLGEVLGDVEMLSSSCEEYSLRDVCFSVVSAKAFEGVASSGA
jgi:hypothetical protein